MIKLKEKSFFENTWGGLETEHLGIVLLETIESGKQPQ